MDNSGKYLELRRQYPEFVYENYSYEVREDGMHLSFRFRLSDDLCFEPTAFIPARRFLDFRQPRQVLDTLVFNIGMIELISYWKCACPPIVRILCGALTEKQQDFWRKLYFNGLGEFFYINGIDASMQDFMSFAFSETALGSQRPKVERSPLSGGYLVPIGGGKDSVVTLELLKQKSNVIPLIMNPRGATVGCIEAAGYTMDDVLEIRRTIHPLLLDLNSKGFLNGHTPFSAMLAFYTLLASQLSGVSNIALSNESSANESTVIGTTVNHQYSKSLEFEDDFRSYVRSFVGEPYRYFSFLRPLSELQIAMIFGRFDHYHEVFRSCNVGSKQDVWCGRCAKCLFAYIILSPFIAPARLNTIFGKCMLDDEELRTFFEELTGKAEVKPFECVGTISEVNSALSMTLRRWYSSCSDRPSLLRGYEAQEPSTPLHTLFPEHNLTAEEESLLLNHVQRADV